MILTIIISIVVLLVLMILFRFLQLSSVSAITEKNVTFINEIIDKSIESNRIKIIRLIDWHKTYHHPFLAERSYKVHELTDAINNDRFAIFTDLGCFLTNEGIDEKKWLAFSDIIKMPISIEKKCIDYMITSNDQVDFIWGLDPIEKKEKIYLEFPNKGTIESYIVQDGEILDSYHYTKHSTKTKNTSFMYSRTNSKGIIDSYHYALKEPIKKGDHKIYIISYSPIDKTKTYYYRCL